MPDNKFMYDLFADLPLEKKCRTAVVIPVRNEAESIEKTLQAFLKQVDLKGRALNFDEFEILILANNCTDNSVEIIKNFQSENPNLKIRIEDINLPLENANIGFVRRTLFEAAFKRLKKNRFGRGIIMTTDGDTVVADNWIAANTFEIEKGADAVGGRIIISETELAKMDADCCEIHLTDEEYRLLTAEIESLIDDLPFDGFPRHHQHFNASFAVKTEVYEKAGGIPDVKFLEDCAFFESLQRIDASIRHSPLVRVYTSSRRTGRSEVGLSFQINEWKKLKERDEDFLVETAEAIVERFSAKRDLRKIWKDFSNKKNLALDAVKDSAASIFVSAEFISGELKKNQTFGAFYESLMREQDRVGKWRQKFPPAALDSVLKKLKKETEKRRSAANVQSFSQTSMR